MSVGSVPQCSHAYTTHQPALVLVVGVLRMWLLPFLPVAVVKVIAGVQRLLRLVDETAAAADRAQSQLGHGREQGRAQTGSLEKTNKKPQKMTNGNSPSFTLSFVRLCPH